MLWLHGIFDWTGIVAWRHRLTAVGYLMAIQSPLWRGDLGVCSLLLFDTPRPSGTALKRGIRMVRSGIEHMETKKPHGGVG